MSPTPDRLHLAALLVPDERVMGMGGQAGRYDLRGRRLPVLAREQGIERGAQPLSLLVDLAAAAAGGEDTAYLVSAVHLTDRFRSLVYRDTAIARLDLIANDRLVWEVWDDQAGFTAIGVDDEVAGRLGLGEQIPATGPGRRLAEAERR